MKVLPFKTVSDADAVAPGVLAHLERGGLLAYPTETVYGLGSRAQAADLATLAEMTQRPLMKPFLLLVAGKKMVHDLGLRFTPAADRLAASFWPGPLTLVLDRGDSPLPPQLVGNNNGVAVRWSSHIATGRLVERLGLPISSTSANISGKEPRRDVPGILAEFDGLVKTDCLLVLDGGIAPKALPSTLVDCTSAEPKILREGAISRHQISACLEEISD